MDGTQLFIYIYIHAYIFPYFHQNKMFKFLGSLLQCIGQKNSVIFIERTRILIYLNFVETDFFLKIISPSAGENSGDSSVALTILQFLPC